MTAPRVTIGMPVYNNAETIARAIASVRGQGFRDWRLIVTDDGSDDGSFDVAKDAAGDDTRIENRRNNTRLGQMNFAVSLREATTDWFVWLSADDYWAPDFLEKSLTAAEAQPEAVSVLPRWSYTGLEAAAPRTLPLDGPRRDRVRKFLAAPGGTRMYGLTRREAMQRAFPRRAFHAYDWYLVLGLIRQGPQIEVPDVLLFREKTPLRSYVEAASRENAILPTWPVARMSLAAIPNGRVPVSTLGSLFMLNLRKHEEHLVYMKPARYARRKWLFRLLGLPLASKPQLLRQIASELVKTAPDRRAGAITLLDRLIRDGDGDAAYTLGQLQEDRLADGNAEATFKRGAQLGSPDAAFRLALLRSKESTLTETEFWSAVIDASATSDAARHHLDEARRSGTIPRDAEAAARYRRTA